MKKINTLLIFILSTVCFCESGVHKINSTQYIKKERKNKSKPNYKKVLRKLHKEYIDSKFQLEEKFDKLQAQLKRKHLNKEHIPKGYEFSKLELDKELNKLLNNLEEEYLQSRRNLKENHKKKYKKRKRQKIIYNTPKSDGSFPSDKHCPLK